MKDEQEGKIMTEFAAPRLKIYFYLMYDGNTNKNAKGRKKCVTKRKLEFNDYKNCLLNSEIILKLQQKIKSEAHNV